MRKTILLFVFFISMYCLQAQTSSENLKNTKGTFGLRSGYEFQTNTSNLNYKLNLPYLGAWYNFKFSKNWGLQLELNLRSENRERLFNSDFTESINEVYLTVPVLIKYNLNNNFKVYTGTQVLSASLVNDIFGLKKWNGIIGLEYNLTKNFFLDCRFRHGFEERMYTGNFRDNRISVGIGYKF